MSVAPFCALCTGPLDARAVQAPFGRDGALVTICHACDSEHPRQTGPRFDASDRGGPGNNGVGEGNRRHGALNTGHHITRRR